LLARLAEAENRTRQADNPGDMGLLQICYVLSTNGEPHYGDLLAVSAQAVRRLYPNAKITILTDDQSWGPVASLGRELGAFVRSAGAYPGDARVRSRFVKTRVRGVVDGDFLYLDADTLPVAPFSELLACEAPLCAAINRTRMEPFGGFPVEQGPYFERLGWTHPTACYLNTGVVFWRECKAARELGQLWHQNWRDFFEAVDNPLDQAAFNFSIATLGIAPKIVDDRFNFRPGLSPELTTGACIYHFYAHGDEMLEGTILDALLNGYRAGGRIDFSLIDGAVRRGHPWIAKTPREIADSADALPAAVPATIEQLPALPSLGLLSPQWDGIEGLAADPLDVLAVTHESPLGLTATPTTGRHRLGIKIRGIDTDQIYRVSASLKAASPVNLYLELRDDAATHYGKASFKLHGAAVYGADPAIIAFGLTSETNGWTRIWAEMKFTGDLAVAYVWLANSLGKPEFLGDGRAGITFGGINIVRQDHERL
jgi:hypothetical protein